MKKITFILTIATILLGMSRPAMADSTSSTSSSNSSTIAWEKHNSPYTECIVTSSTKDTTFVYLYNAAEGLFLTSGGSWGTEGILANSGMRFWIEEVSSNSGTFYIHTRLDNKKDGDAGNYLTRYPDNQKTNNPNSIFFDRSKDDADNSSYGGVWSFKSVSGTTNGYTIYNEKAKQYVAYADNVISFVDDAANASVWYMVSHKDLIAAIKDEAVNYLGISEMLMDPRFERNNVDEVNWKFENGKSTTTSYISTYVYDGAFATARIYGVNNMYQEVADLPTGYYRISCQGFYNGDEANNDAYLYFQIIEDEKVTDEGSVKLLCATSTDQGTLKLNTNTTNGIYLKTRAITAGSIIAGNNIYATGAEENPYFNSIYFKLKEGQKLRIGVKKTTNTDDEVYVDNFRLFYMVGDVVIYLDANAKPDEEYSIDNNDHTEATVAYLRRSLKQDKWNAICLPFDVSATSLKQAFGDGVKLSVLSGINPNQKTQIVFKTVNLDSKEDNAGIEANKCYVIKPTAAPAVATKNDTEEIYSLVGASNDATKKKRKITVKGPIYKLYGVTQSHYDLVSGSDPMPYSNTVTTDGGTLRWTCYYVKTSAPANSYIVQSGIMYHLTSTYNIYGTSWMIEDVDSSDGKKSTFSIDFDDYDTSEICGLVVNSKNDTDTRIYNLNGMAVGTAAQMDRMPKGIYIMNGKKFVVR